MDATKKSFARYFPVSLRDRKWGWYVTTVGENAILPGQPYPPDGHPKGYGFDWEKGRVLDCHALVYISRGRGVFESDKRGSQSIAAGQVFLLFPGVWHRYRPDVASGWNEHWLGFDGDVARGWVKQGFFLRRAPVFKPGQEEKWLTLFTELITAVKLNQPALQQVMAGFAAQMLGLLYSGQQSSRVGGEQALQFIQQALGRMRAELETGLDVKSLARDLNISYSSFRQTFQQHTGTSPHQYLLELRLARARNLLTQTPLSVKEIAQQTGFEDEHYFSRFFKMKTGHTPGHWRLRSQTKPGM